MTMVKSSKKQQRITWVIVMAPMVLAVVIAMLFAQHTAVVPDRSSASESLVAIQRGAGQYQAITVPSETVLQNTPPQTIDRLIYLLEEEKLAHDVYLAMHEQYGARVFGNILSSEDTHQSRVLALLAVRDIADPRANIAGQFINQNLQKLYDDLIARGSQNINEAYAIGIAIEELDITDIKNDIALLEPEQTDIRTTLEALLNGSENHLRAFSRQVR